MQVGLLLLLLVDVLVVLVELFLDAEFPPCSVILRNAHSFAELSGSSATVLRYTVASTAFTR